MGDKAMSTNGKLRKGYDAFTGQLEERAEHYAALLPPDLPVERFTAAAMSAAQQNPDLLLCDQRSLFGAVTKAAQDGILPDGRDGVIVSYKGVAQWMPMVAGLRRRAYELDGIMVSAEVVHVRDDFFVELGDEPSIVHRPPKLGAERGRMVGVYAIFRRGGEVIHREVMDESQIEAVRSQSRVPGSLMWTKFATEAWRKTVIRRGFKSVPAGLALDRIVRRGDVEFDLDGVEVPAKPVVIDAVAEKGRAKSLAGRISDRTRAVRSAPASAPASAPKKTNADGNRAAAKLMARVEGLDSEADARRFIDGVSGYNVLSEAHKERLIEAATARIGEIAGADVQAQPEPDVADQSWIDDLEREELAAGAAL